MKDWLLFFIGIVLLCAGCYYLGAKNTITRVENDVTDTITIYDTISDLKADTMWLCRYDTLEYYQCDTIWENGEIEIIEDTIIVPVPISTYQFDTTILTEQHETSINAVISGFDVNVEQLTATTKITQQRQNFRGSRWSFGIYGGYGVNKEGSSLQVGVGIMYKIL